MYIMKMLLVSNMYPSEADPQYATFVQNIKEALVASACMDVYSSDTRQKPTSLRRIYLYLVFLSNDRASPPW